eukprot:g24030.t2
MAEDAKRMDRTVMVVGLSTRADERDVFEFFSGRAGTVKDVQIIRDARTGKSKGVCFVEFSTAEGMVKSLSMTGQTIKGARVQVQQSQVAEGRGTHASRGKLRSSLYGHFRSWPAHVQGRYLCFASKFQCIFGQVPGQRRGARDPVLDV